MPELNPEELFGSVSPWPDLPQYEKPELKENKLKKYLPIALTIAAAIGRGTSGNQARRQEAVPRAMQNLNFLKQIQEQKRAEAEKGAQQEYQTGMAAYTDAVNRRKQDIDVAQGIMSERGKTSRMKKEYGLKKDLAEIGSKLNVEEIEASGEENRKTIVHKYGAKINEINTPTIPQVISYYKAQNPGMSETEKMFSAMAIAQQSGKNIMDVYSDMGQGKGMTNEDFQNAYWELFYQQNPKILESDMKDFDAEIAKMQPEEIEALKNGTKKEQALYNRIQARFRQQKGEKESTYNRLDAILGMGK